MADSSLLYVSIPGVVGKVRDKGYEGWLEGLSYSFGPLSRKQGVGPVIRPGAGELLVRFTSGKTSGPLMLLASDGRHVDKVRVDLVKAGKKRELLISYNLGTSLVIAFSTSQNVDEVTFAYTTLRVTTTGKGPVLDTKAPASWNLKK